MQISHSSSLMVLEQLGKLVVILIGKELVIQI